MHFGSTHGPGFCIDSRYAVQVNNGLNSFYECFNWDLIEIDPFSENESKARFLNNKATL